MTKQARGLARRLAHAPEGLLDRVPQAEAGDGQPQLVGEVARDDSPGEAPELGREDPRVQRDPRLAVARDDLVRVVKVGEGGPFLVDRRLPPPALGQDDDEPASGAGSAQRPGRR